MPVPLLAMLAAGQIAAASPSEICMRAAARAERHWNLPDHLLLAIGQVESGRPDPATGQTQPWPWSADAGGQDYVFRSAAEASTVVGYLQHDGVGSIDVGCFQVSLRYHPHAFRSVAEGFDPQANADYAARLLRGLFARSGDWGSAVAQYHSADPLLGGPYEARVLQAWLGTARPAWPAEAHVALTGANWAAMPLYTAQTLPARWRAALGLSPPSTRHR